MKFQSAIEQWKYFGNYYGYPKCCIDSFCNEVITRSQRKAGNNTGFIPCKDHARMILNKEKTLDSLMSVPKPIGLN